MYETFVYPVDGPEIAGAFGAAATVKTQLGPQLLLSSVSETTEVGWSAQSRTACVPELGVHVGETACLDWPAFMPVIEFDASRLVSQVLLLPRSIWKRFENVAPVDPEPPLVTFALNVAESPATRLPEFKLAMPEVKSMVPAVTVTVADLFADPPAPVQVTV